MSSLTLTFLGTGTSNGVPIIGCRCPVCTSDDPRDRRSRTSAYVEDHANGKAYLIDMATELRLQAIANGIERVDAVLMTHAHADHSGGLDDMRRFNELQGERIPLYANAVAAEMTVERFGYAFTEDFPFWGGKPDLDLHVVAEPWDLHGRRIVPVPVQHGRLTVFGYRIGPLGYVTDAKVVPPESMRQLEGVEVLVINALRERPHPTHLSVDEALAVIADLRPKRAYLVHLSHDLGHAAAQALLPEGVEVAYDGLKVEVGLRTRAETE